MKCQLTTSCDKEAGLVKLKVNDWRTAYREQDVAACEDCLAREPQVKAEHEEWLAKQPKKKS